jgi:hypothetical protein
MTAGRIAVACLALIAAALTAFFAVMATMAEAESHELEEAS